MIITTKTDPKTSQAASWEHGHTRSVRLLGIEHGLQRAGVSGQCSPINVAPLSLLANHIHFGLGHCPVSFFFHAECRCLANCKYLETPSLWVATGNPYKTKMILPQLRHLLAQIPDTNCADCPISDSCQPRVALQQSAHITSGQTANHDTNIIHVASNHSLDSLSILKVLGIRLTSLPRHFIFQQSRSVLCAWQFQLSQLRVKDPISNHTNLANNFIINPFINKVGLNS